MAKNLLRIIIRDRFDIPIYQGDISDIGLTKSLVIQKSIEWYNDPTPCYRHRDAVKSRIVLDVLNYLQKQKALGINKTYISSIPATVRQCFNYYKDAKSIELV